MISLTIAHNIFLTREQRYALMNEHCYTAEVAGFNNPVWSKGDQTSEPCEEIFCKYAMTNVRDTSMVKILKNGYQIHINSHKDKQRLLDVKDKGSESLMMTYHKKMVSKKGKPFFVIHFISINDWEALEKSIDYGH